jgi:hypothetical protein
MSTKTGWAMMTIVDQKLVLNAYGQFPAISEPAYPYPESYLVWANQIFEKIRDLFDTFNPDIAVIEETAGGSKSNYSQKILEFIHFRVARYVTDRGTPTKYFMTEEWRRICGCKMTKEESKRNKEVRDFKKKHGTKLAKNTDGKVIGRIGRKHVNVRRANEIFDGQLKEALRKKDEDTADALLLGAAYHLQKWAPTKQTTLKGLRDNGKTA